LLQKIAGQSDASQALAEIIVQILADPALFVLADFQNILFESLPLDRCGNDVGNRLQKI
jgi:hypothetical protein